METLWNSELFVISWTIWTAEQLKLQVNRFNQGDTWNILLPPQTLSLGFKGHKATSLHHKESTFINQRPELTVLIVRQLLVFAADLWPQLVLQRRAGSTGGQEAPSPKINRNELHQINTDMQGWTDHNVLPRAPVVHGTVDVPVGAETVQTAQLGTETAGQQVFISTQGFSSKAALHQKIHNNQLWNNCYVLWALYNYFCLFFLSYLIYFGVWIISYFGNWFD